MDPTSDNWRPMAAAYGEQQACAPREAAVIAAAVLAELGRMHRGGKAHGCVDPAHVLLGGGGRAKLAAPDGTGLASYQAPEQHAGQPASPRSDLFSAGLVFYRLLTGLNPFEGSAALVKQRVTNMVAPAPSDVRNGVPTTFDPLVEKALAKRPEDRFTSAEAFAEALMQALMPGASHSAPDGDATLATTVLRRPAGDDATVMRGPPPDATVMRGPAPDATVMRAPAPRAEDPEATVLRAPSAPSGPVRGTAPSPGGAAPSAVPASAKSPSGGGSGGGKGLVLGVVAAVVLAGVAAVAFLLK